jgi:nitrile hydratase accessory protein
MSELPQMETAAFADPWQARAFALAVALNEAGHLDWSEWTRLLSAEIAAREGGSNPPGPGDEAYYECWMAALEKASARLA